MADHDMNPDARELNRAPSFDASVLSALLGFATHELDLQFASYGLGVTLERVN